MPFLRDDILREYHAGKYLAKLKAHTRAWRRHPTPYVLANVVQNAAEDDRAEELYEVLLDDEFREIRQSRFGINDLRSDLQIGRDYFSAKRPDLIRYMQFIFLEQLTEDDPESLRAHQRHCQGMADFLQLDCLPTERANIGLHRVLHRFFPITSEPNAWYGPRRQKDPVSVHLADFELGEWRCSCGNRQGLSRRYDFSCPCSSVSGNGRLNKEDSVLCQDCGQVPCYTKCGQCGTRVTLGIFWLIKEGSAHPSVYSIPLTLNLLVEGAGSDVRRIDFVLMYFPLMLGVREREGEVVFELPDIFWFRDDYRNSDEVFGEGSFVNLSDLPRYDRQTDARKIFEAAFRRSLWGREGTYKAFEEELLKDVVFGDRGRSLTRRCTEGFQRRLSRNLGAVGARAEHVFRFWDVSQECVVAASPLLRNNMVFINRRLTGPSALAVPQLVALKAILKDGKILTSEPPNVAKSRTSHLDKTGIARPGSMIAPGDLLVGVASPAREEELTPEERLLRAIFGETEAPALRDRSLVMPGNRPGRVISEYISRHTEREEPDIPAFPGRFIDWRGGSPIALQVTITLAMDQCVEAGDTLLAEASPAAVVCGIFNGTSLRRAASTLVEPDLVVATDHPWAPTEGNQRTLRVHLRKTGLAGVDAASHASSAYSTVSAQPWDEEETDGFAQRLTSAEFEWLIQRDAGNLAFELYAPRSDCPDMRTALYASLIEGQAKLADLKTDAPHETFALRNNPSEAVRNWSKLLTVSRIAPVADPTGFTFEAITDADVMAMSFGEVTDIGIYDDPITGRPVAGGLFCERIFGPLDAWKCACGKYRGKRSEGHVCEDCHVEVSDPHTRKDRMGHIALAAPMIHCWYLRGANANRMAALLGISAFDLQRIADYRIHVVIDPGAAPLHVGQVLESHELSEIRQNYPEQPIQTAVGGEAIEMLLQLSEYPPAALASLRRIVFRMLPVLPPKIRLNARFSPRHLDLSDLNYFYGQVILLNGQLNRAMHGIGGHYIDVDARRGLQAAVDRLLDNSRCMLPSSRVSLGEALNLRTETGGTVKDGFLQRALNFSGRTRLVAAETPSIDTAMLPVQISWDLFEPVLAGELCKSGIAESLRSANEQIRRRSAAALDELKKICFRSLILIGPSSGPWPLIALRIRTTRDLALKVHPALLDLIGWDNLGEHVKVFSILTTEAKLDAVKHLTPTRLQCGKQRTMQNAALSGSIFEISQDKFLDEVSWSTLTQEKFPASKWDPLILCDTDRLNLDPQ